MAIKIVLGKWIIVKDSLEWGGEGVSHMETDSDYYDFKNTGIVVIKEGTKIRLCQLLYHK